MQILFHTGNLSLRGRNSNNGPVNHATMHAPGSEIWDIHNWKVDVVFGHFDVDLLDYFSNISCGFHSCILLAKWGESDLDSLPSVTKVTKLKNK